MKRPWILVTALAVLIQACGVLPSAEIPSSDRVVQTPTVLAIVIPASIPLELAPTLPSPAPTLPPPPASPPVEAYTLREEHVINSYAIRLWGDPADTLGFNNVLLIEQAGVASLRIDMASAIHPQTGSDLNGDGFPEAVIETYSGGAHCCFGTQVYSLRDAPLLILQKPESNAGGQFQDLDGDNVQEFVTYDDLFAYRYCAYAASPAVKAILAYDPSAQRYSPASPRFLEQYVDDITRHVNQAQGNLDDFIGEDGTPKCGVLPVVLDYLYIGQTEKAHQELLRLYAYPDAETFWNEVLSAVQQSPLYTPQ